MLTSVAQLIGWGIVILIVVLAEMLDWKGRFEMVERDYPRIWRAINNRPARLVLLAVAIVFLAKDFKDAVSIAPPSVQDIRITEPKLIPSTGKEYPYELQASIQTNVTIQPITLFIECDVPLKDGDFILPYTQPWVGSHEVIKDHPNIFGLRLSQPAFRPVEPIIIHLYSMQPIRIVKFWREEGPQ